MYITTTTRHEVINNSSSRAPLCITAAGLSITVLHHVTRQPDCTSFTLYTLFFYCFYLLLVFLRLLHICTMYLCIGLCRFALISTLTRHLDLAWSEPGCSGLYVLCGGMSCFYLLYEVDPWKDSAWMNHTIISLRSVFYVFFVGLCHVLSGAH